MPEMSIYLLKLSMQNEYNAAHSNRVCMLSIAKLLNMCITQHSDIITHQLSPS